jgi:hypothetical protein
MQTQLSAQFQLVIENPNAFKRDRILVGSEIGIRVKGMDQIYHGELERVKADKIYIFGDSLSPDSLDRFQIARERGGINMLRGALIMSAVIYPVMLVLNQKTSAWTWNKAARVAAFSASALLVQRLLKVAYWKRYRLDKGNWRLKIMPTPESLLPDLNP